MLPNVTALKETGLFSYQSSFFSKPMKNKNLNIELILIGHIIHTLIYLIIRYIKESRKIFLNGVNWLFFLLPLVTVLNSN